MFFSLQEQKTDYFLKQANKIRDDGELVSRDLFKFFPSTFFRWAAHKHATLAMATCLVLINKLERLRRIIQRDFCATCRNLSATRRIYRHAFKLLNRQLSPYLNLREQIVRSNTRPSNLFTRLLKQQIITLKSIDGSINQSNFFARKVNHSIQVNLKRKSDARLI